VTNNGRQFMDKDIEKFLKQIGVKHLVSLVEHPQKNGQVKAANKVTLHELRKTMLNQVVFKF